MSQSVGGLVVLLLDFCSVDEVAEVFSMASGAKVESRFSSSAVVNPDVTKSAFGPI